MKKNKGFIIDKIINTFIINNIASYILKNDRSIVLKYEIYNKYKRIYIYLNNWEQLINLYKIIPNENKHFYEVIGDYCKFFLILNMKKNNNNYKWIDNIKIIKNELKIFFKRIFGKNIDILEYRYINKEKKEGYICHLIIQKYCFNSDQCKYICDLFLKELNIYSDLIDIIDKNVYGKNKTLMIVGSKKINSENIKLFFYDDFNNIYSKNIYIKGLITNIEDTLLLSFDNYINDFIYDEIFNIDINYYFDDYYINIYEDINIEFDIKDNMGLCHKVDCFNIKDVYENLCKYHVNEQKTIKNDDIISFINKRYQNINNYEIKDLLNIEKIILKDYIYNNHISYVRDILNIENEINSNFVKKEQNLNIDKNGYLYIIKTRESVRMKENIYKIGCTGDIIRRYRQYPKGSKLIYTIIHYNYKKLEKEWINILNNNKLLMRRKDMGNEYYEGDYHLIINELTKILHN